MPEDNKKPFWKKLSGILYDEEKPKEEPPSEQQPVESPPPGVQIVNQQVGRTNLPETIEVTGNDSELKAKFKEKILSKIEGEDLWNTFQKTVEGLKDFVPFDKWYAAAAASLSKSSKIDLPSISSSLQERMTKLKGEAQKFLQSSTIKMQEIGRKKEELKNIDLKIEQLQKQISECQEQIQQLSNEKQQQIAELDQQETKVTIQKTVFDSAISEIQQNLENEITKLESLKGGEIK